ncbi:MAG: hypothetical protein JSS20_11465, partial [Proteobacteria bacterium]|nr:hypothetical protein [Pseudomonadota bacterium]
RLKTRYLKPDGSSMTLTEVASNHGRSVGLPQFVGTPKSVADQMEAFIDEVGGDGFMLSSIDAPGAIERFVADVIPELRRRGRVRTEYQGRTLREVLKQEV